MKIDDEINALLEIGSRKNALEPPPKELAPILKRMAERAEKGEAIAVNVLLDYIEKKIGRRIGITVAHRWIKESGGTPWFRK